jgi:ABC-type transport system involved in multi-copper enzyme maturation permease subunit
MKIIAIALNTFKEAVRNKIFYLLVFFGIFFALSSQLVSLLTIGDRVKVLKDVGLASIHFFSVLTAIFTGINLVYKEIDKKTIYNILSKPISRSSFIIGKFLGLAYTLLVALASMAVIFFLFLLISTGEFDSRIALYFLLLYFELLVITAISLLFSSFTTPILSTIFTITLFLIGHLLWTFNEFKDRLLQPVVKEIAYFFYYLLPNLDKFNIKNAVVVKAQLEPGLVFNSILYAIAYIGALLTLTIIIFSRREFQ